MLTLNNSNIFKTILFSLFLCVPLIAQAAQTTGKIGSLDLHRWTTSNGMQVLFAPTHELPIVDLRLVFDAGGARDVAGKVPKPGLAKLTNGLVFEGSEGISANEIAKTFEGLGVQYGNSSHRDMAVLDLRSLSEKPIIDTALNTLNTILAKPSFDSAVLDRERNKLLVALNLAEQNPSSKASLAFYKAMYSNSQQEHPYASPSNGTKESLEAIQRQDLVDYYQQYYVAPNAILAVVGDLTIERVKILAERLSKTLGDGEHAPALPAVQSADAGKNITIEHPSTQTTIVLGQPILKRGDDDYYALYLGNHILGGSGFSSRLVKEVRVKRGLTYSVGSHFIAMRAEGPFQISLTTKNQSAAEAVGIVNEVLLDFIKNGPTEEEIEESKLNISGSFPLRTASNKSIVEHLAVIGFYNLPENYLDIFKQKIQSVSREQIIDAFKRRVIPAKMSTIIVGAKAK